ncbi:uncharacterized protein LOC128221038 isoform X2 [Mya arenaria]|uniref:uncharacterized protein LOC128221038 isoform X2 n=1 Tax=Mya arenaria TaxID=6604 RepID=UPI0022E0C409|nr:uncharacterized protein LOC128221038 isoform X2 [Mya arenaria]
MPRHWMLICAQLAVFLFAHVCYVSKAMNQYGTMSVEGPAFVNRDVTLKATPFYPWGCDVEWICIKNARSTLQIMNGTNVKRYMEDGSFFMKWKASFEYNKSDFYAGCITNTTIKTPMVTLNMKDIVGQCGALVLFSPVVRGANVELGYFPADVYIQRQTYNTRTWKKNTNAIQLRNGSYEEDKVSEYVYKLTVFNFDETNEGTYTLVCNPGGSTESVHVYMQERPSYPILGPMSLDFNTTECIYVYAGSDVYCKTDNGTEPVKVVLLLEHDLFVYAEIRVNKGVYRFHNVYQLMAGQSRRNVTCQVSNAALETPHKVHGILCNVEKGSPPELTVPQFLDGESSAAVCEVHNAIPAPAIEIYVGTVLLADVQQSDLFNKSSNTFTSQAKTTKTYKSWNGNEMCCTTQSNDYFGLKAVSICKNISMKCRQCQDNQTFSSIFRFPIKNLLIGTGVFCGICIVLAIGRCIFLKRRKVSNIITIESVENHSDVLADNDVSHITMEGVQLAVVQRQPAQKSIETQQPHTDDSHAYDELDTNFQQEAQARVPSKRNDTPTKYTIIEFSSTQEPAVEDKCTTMHQC